MKFVVHVAAYAVFKVESTSRESEAVCSLCLRVVVALPSRVEVAPCLALHLAFMLS